MRRQRFYPTGGRAPDPRGRRVLSDEAFVLLCFFVLIVFFVADHFVSLWRKS